MKQIPLPMVLPPDQRFDTLVVGPNAHAVQHLQALAQAAVAGPPVYLWGAAGTGKTRLLRALATERQAAGEQVGWFSPAASCPWVHDERWSLVLVDDCDALDTAQQQAAFTLFVEADSLGQQWAAAGALPPVDLPLRDDLRTRLGWGHVFALKPLADTETRAALRREADRRGMLLPDDVIDYLQSRFARDIQHQMALLGQLDRFALAEQRLLTVPLIKKMLADPLTDADSPVEPSPSGA